MRRLLRRLKSSTEDGTNNASSRGTTITPPAILTPSQKTSSTGIKLLYAAETSVVDIIFIHGLTGDQQRTWTAANAPGPWPLILLPSKLSNVRILTFGYDAYVTDWRGLVSENKIANHAMNLLTSTATFREQDDTNCRPIIFVCHSLGGLVCQDALVMARQRPEQHLHNILLATRGILFLGTPHRGAGLAQWAEMLARSIGLVKQTNVDIVAVLKRESEVLARIQDGFHSMIRSRIQEKMQPIEITCCFEELPLLGIGTVVPHESATIPGYVAIGIHRNHMEMTQFEHEHDPGFIAVVGELRRWIKGLALDGESSIEATSPRSFTASERRFIASFGPRCFIDLDERVQGTCSWSTETTQYLSWRREDRSAVLWLTGVAGCGKTVLTNFLVKHLEEQSDAFRGRRGNDMVCSFFCARDVQSQNDVRSLVKDLILQILIPRKEVIHQIKSSFGYVRDEYEPSFETLWRIFQMAIEIVPCQHIYIVIDALDECEERSKSRLLSKIAQSLMALKTSNVASPKRVKLILSGQPQIKTAWSTPVANLGHYHINIEERPEGMVNDLNRFVDFRVNELVQSSVCSRASGDKLKKTLKALAENSFLWLSVVLNDIKTSLNYRDTDFQRLLADVPRNLGEAYARYLPRVAATEIPALRKYLNLIVACTRPLTLTEVDAFTGLDGHPLGSALDPEELNVIKGSLQRALGPLVKFPNGTVQLIHSTVKEFFLRLHSDTKHPLSGVHGVDPVSAHLHCAMSCMRYLAHEKIPADLFDPLRSNPDSYTTSPVSVRQSLRSDVEIQDDTIFNDLFDIQNVGFLRDESTFYDEVCTSIRERFEAYDYAACNWTYHWAQGEHRAEDDVMEQAIALLTCVPDRFNNWYKYRAQKSHIEMPAVSELDPVVLAALFNHARTVRVLLDRHGYQKSDLCLDKALYWAASRGNCGTMQVLLDHGVQAQIPGTGKSPLAVAVRGGFADACSLLLNGGADPNWPDQASKLPLALAASHNHLKILRSLLKHSLIQVDLTDAAGQTALMEACRNGSFQCVQAILEDGRADINEKDRNARTSLHHACMTGNDRAVKALLAISKLDLGARDCDGRDAMSIASQNGHMSIVKRLHGVKLSAANVDNQGRNAISWAANSRKATLGNNGGESVLEYLVKRYPGAVDVQDANGWSPLAWALDRPGYLDAVKILLEVGHANVNQYDHVFNRSILSWASSEGFVHIVRYLLQVPGVEKNQLSQDGRTPLSYAAANGMFEAVQALLDDKDVLTNIPDCQGRTPVQWARLNNHDGVVKLFDKCREHI